MIATVERVQHGWMVLIDGKPHTLHDERSCDYAMQNAHAQALKINRDNNDMKRLNNDHNQPLRFEGAGKVIGQFYNSLDKRYHLAEYVPYERPPHVYLCGKVGNFSGSRREHKRLLCTACWRGFDA